MDQDRVEVHKHINKNKVNNQLPYLDQTSLQCIVNEGFIADMEKSLNTIL